MTDWQWHEAEPTVRETPQGLHVTATLDKRLGVGVRVPSRVSSFSLRWRWFPRHPWKANKRSYTR